MALLKTLSDSHDQGHDQGHTFLLVIMVKGPGHYHQASEMFLAAQAVLGAAWQSLSHGNPK